MQDHSHHSQNSLSLLATVGGSLLAFNAGFINSTGLMGFDHKTISHLTGTVTLSAIALSKYEGIFETGTLVGSFFAGATLSGVIIGGMTLKFGRRYGVALIFEGVLLFLAWNLFKNHSHAGEFLAAMACGLQNALVTTLSGAVIRTTHLTGVVTDLGNIFGNFLCGRNIDNKHPFLLFMLLFSFFTGALAGAISFVTYELDNILFSSLFTLLLGSVYLVIRLLTSDHHSNIPHIGASC